MTTEIRPNWVHSIDKAVSKLNRYWRQGSGCADELKEIRAYLESQLAAAPAQAEPATVEDTRAEFEQTMRRLSNGEPDWNSPAALWAYAAWNARGIFDAKAQTTPSRS